MEFYNLSQNIYLIPHLRLHQPQRLRHDENGNEDADTNIYVGVDGVTLLIFKKIIFKFSVVNVVSTLLDGNIFII
jgi:hypothetical protein